MKFDLDSAFVCRRFVRSDNEAFTSDEAARQRPFRLHLDHLLRGGGDDVSDSE